MENKTLITSVKVIVPPATTKEKQRRASHKTMIFVYGSNKKFKGKYSLAEYSSKVGVSNTTILTAARSFCGYGFVKKDYVSLSEVKEFYSIEWQMNNFNSWLKTYLKKITNTLKKKYKDSYDYEYLSKALLYITEVINVGGLINNYESALYYKFRTFMLDNKRTSEARKKKGLTSDFIINESGTTYIDIATANDYMWSDKDYDCVEDYNSIKQYDVIGYLLKEKYNRIQADMFVEALQSIPEFESILVIPPFKFTTLIRKYKAELNALKKIDTRDVKKLANVKYIEMLFNECWTTMIESLDRIREEADTHSFKTVDNYTLRELM